MANAFFDIEKLKKIEEMDAQDAVNNFVNMQAYFNELEEFIFEAQSYPHDFNPAMAVHSPDMRAEFLHKLQTVKYNATTLKIHALLSTAENLEHAVKIGSADTLSDWLIQFRGQMDKLLQSLSEARSDGKENTEEAQEKPVILAVDDMPEILTTIVSILRDKYHVVAVISAEDALKAIATHSPSLFLLDIAMPFISGYELATIIRMDKRFEKTPIIFITSKGSREDVITAVANGGNDYIIKPVRKNLLISKVKKYLG